MSTPSEPVDPAAHPPTPRAPWPSDAPAVPGPPMPYPTGGYPAGGVPTAAPGGYPVAPGGFPSPAPGGYPVTQGGFVVPPQAYQQAGYPPPGYPGRPPFPVSPGGYRLADFGDRFLAFLIDGLILGGIAAVLIFPLMFCLLIPLMNNAIVSPSTDPNDPFGTGNGQLPSGFVLVFFGVFAAFFVLILVVRYVYQVEMMWKTGQTVGKRVMKLRIIPVDPALALTRGMAFKRFLIESVLAPIVPLLTYVDGLWQLWDQPFRQCLHDKYAQTLVIKLNA